MTRTPEIAPAQNLESIEKKTCRSNLGRGEEFDPFGSASKRANAGPKGLPGDGGRVVCHHDWTFGFMLWGHLFHTMVNLQPGNRLLLLDTAEKRGVCWFQGQARGSSDRATKCFGWCFPC